MGEVGRAEAGRAAAGRVEPSLDAPQQPPEPAGMAQLEAIDRDGSVRQSWRILRWPVTIGRALDNDVVLSDASVAAHHATINLRRSIDAGTAKITVSAGNTLNGLTIGRDTLAGGATSTFDDSGRDLELHIARSTLRLRLPGHALAPEQRLAPTVGRNLGWLGTVLLALALLAVVLFNVYLDADPDSLVRLAGAVVLRALVTAVLWCGFWALLSKLFTRQSHFAWHVRVFLIAGLVSLALAAVPPLIAFAFSWSWVTDYSFIAVYATIAVAVYFHLLAVEPGRRRLTSAIATTGFVVAVALALWFNIQATGRPGAELYMNHLFPPQVRLARPVPVDQFVSRLAPLQATLDQQAKDRSGSDGDGSGEEDDGG